MDKHNNFKDGLNDDDSTLGIVLSTIITLFFALAFFKLGFIAALQAWSHFSNLTMYVLIAIYALVVGVIIAYIYDKTKSYKKFILAGVKYSSIMAFFFAINSVIAFVLDQTKGDIASMASTECFASFLKGLNIQVFDPIIGFFVALVFLNLAFIVHYFKRKDKNWKTLGLNSLLYIIPIGVFFIMTIILNWIAKTIILMFR